jgi:hypothetical protein
MVGNKFPTLFKNEIFTNFNCKMKSKLVNFKNLNIQSDPFNVQTANNIFQSADKLSPFLVWSAVRKIDQSFFLFGLPNQFFMDDLRNFTISSTTNFLPPLVTGLIKKTDKFSKALFRTKIFVSFGNSPLINSVSCHVKYITLIASCNK